MTLKPKALKPKEAFELLGISRHLGATLIHSGRLHHIKDRPQNGDPYMGNRSIIRRRLRGQKVTLSRD